MAFEESGPWKEGRMLRLALGPAESRGSPRVCVLTSRHELRDIRIYLKQCRSLAEAGYSVTLLAHVREDSGLHGAGGRGSRFLRIPRAAFRALARVARAYRAAAGLDSPLYHIHDPELLVPALLLRFAGKAVIYDIHEDFPRQLADNLRAGGGSPGFLEKAVEMSADGVETFCAGRMSAFVPATPAIALRFEGMGKPLAIVRNLPLAGELRPRDRKPWSKRDRALAFVGGINKARGLLPMVDAMALIPARWEARLRLMGDFSPASHRAEAEGRPGWSRVDFLGKLDREEVREELGRVRAGMLLFQPAGNHVEAMPNKLFEYMDAGLPIIASDFPLWRELLEPLGCAILVPPSDPRAIAAAVERLMRRPREAEAMGRRGRLAVDRELNWDRESRKLVGLYGKVRGDPSGS